jgi:hypothetical protein
MTIPEIQGAGRAAIGADVALNAVGFKRCHAIASFALAAEAAAKGTHSFRRHFSRFEQRVVPP